MMTSDQIRFRRTLIFCLPSNAKHLLDVLKKRVNYENRKSKWKHRHNKEHEFIFRTNTAYAS